MVSCCNSPCPTTSIRMFYWKPSTPKKIVDGLHPYNYRLPCPTPPELAPLHPLRIVRLLEHYGLEKAGKHPPSSCFKFGRTSHGFRVFECRSYDQRLPPPNARPSALRRTSGYFMRCRRQPGVVSQRLAQTGCVAIDVGITRQNDGSFTGDLDFDTASQRAGWITPVFLGGSAR